jgi:hypothetical protein
VNELLCFRQFYWYFLCICTLFKWNALHASTGKGILLIFILKISATFVENHSLKPHLSTLFNLLAQVHHQVLYLSLSAVISIAMDCFPYQFGSNQHHDFKYLQRLDFPNGSRGINDDYIHHQGYNNNFGSRDLASYNNKDIYNQNSLSLSHLPYLNASRCKSQTVGIGAPINQPPPQSKPWYCSEAFHEPINNQTIQPNNTSTTQPTHTPTP